MTPRVKSDEERAAEKAKRDAAAAAAEAARIAAAEADAERERIRAEGGLQGRHRAAAPSEPTAVTVGDAGASWRAKALKRQRERAAEESASGGQTAAPVRREPEPEWGASSSRQRGGGVDREQQRRRDDAMAAAGFPVSFGKQSGGRGAGAFAAAVAAEAAAAGPADDRPRHAREDADTGMEMVETEEEIEAREARQAQETRARAAAAARAADMARLMKKPAASPTFSPPAAATSASAGASASAPAAGKSWRDKIRSSLTATAAPSTPEGETAKLFSTPLVGAGGLQHQPTPSPLPSPSPSPPPREFGLALTGAGKPLGQGKGREAERFAGMLGPEQLGMDKALHVVMEERASPSPPSASPEELPGFAAGFAPVAAEPSAPSAAAATAAPTPVKLPAAPKGASDADLNKLSAQATKAKLLKQTALYEQLQAKIAQIKADAKAQAETAASAPAQQLEQLHAQAAASGTSGHIHPSRAQPQQQQRPQGQRAPSHAASIEEKIRLLRSTQGGDGAPLRNAAGHEVVVLHTHDAHGRPIAAAVNAASSAAAAAASGAPVRDPTMKNKKLAPNIDETGNRVAYFADDVQDHSLADLVSREKLSRQSAAAGGMQGGHDLDRDWARSIARSDDYKLASTDEQFDATDFSMAMYDRSTSVKNQKRSVQEQENRARSQQIHAASKHDAQVSRCWYCLTAGSREVIKSLIVSIGVRMHLSIPRVNWITPGHVTIVPNDHVLAVTHMDDEVAEELAYFKAHLVRMWAAQKPARKCVFIETVYALQRNQHTLVHCIPLDADLYDDAEIYFAKALDEADEQWSTNKKIIRANQDKGGVRKAVPKNFNYFNVEVRTRNSSAGGGAEATLRPNGNSRNSDCGICFSVCTRSRLHLCAHVLNFCCVCAVRTDGRRSGAHHRGRRFVPREFRSRSCAGHVGRVGSAVPAQSTGGTHGGTEENATILADVEAIRLDQTTRRGR